VIEWVLKRLRMVLAFAYFVLMAKWLIHERF
jgi:hypothetical protein